MSNSATSSAQAYAKRAPGPSVQEILAKDGNPAPEIYLAESVSDMGWDDIPRDRYFSREWHELEKERVWYKTWQVACRVEELAEPGDYYVYDVCDKSVLLTHDNNGEIKAYANSCLHRGTALCTGQGNKKDFRCPFHGFTWALEGDLKYVPGKWDFDHINDEDFRLPEINMEIWGGFVFVNFDKDCVPLSDYLEILPEHLSADELENRYKAVHVSQVVPCNWKVVQEAFMEGYHVAETHYEKDEDGRIATVSRALFSADTNIQYDVWPESKHIDRLMLNVGVVSQYIKNRLTSEQPVIDHMLRKLPPDVRPVLEEGESARPVLADFFRKSLTELYGADMTGLSDLEAMDHIQYNIFPNFTIWATPAAPLCYRFRPWNDSPDEALFEVWMLHPKPEDGRDIEVMKEKRLGPDDQWADCEEMGVFGPVVDEDIPNLPLIQKGLKASEKEGITLATYQESRIRHHHQTLDEYVQGSGQ